MKPQGTTEAGAPAAPRRRELLAAAAIVAVTLLVYLPALRNGFIWDDDDYVTNCEALKAPDGLRQIWLDTRSTPQYYPLVFTVFRLENDFWGLRPAGYHAVNILLHAASALLLWRLLSRLGVPGSWWAAVLFAVHPVQVESVAWVTELKNCLSGFFYLAALWAALKFYLPQKPCVEPCVPSKDGTQGWFQVWAFYGAAFLLFVCALLSKTVTCSLPVAVLLILWWKRGRFSRFEAATLLPFFALGAALALSTTTLEKSHVGAVGLEWNLSFLQRILIAGRALWFYAGKLVWPVPLTFIHPRWDVNAAAPWQYLFPLSALAALAVLWRLRRRIGRGPLAAALFFVLTLTPALGFINVYPMRYSFVADHFQYLASIGLIVLAVAAASLGGRRNRPAMIFCGAVVFAAFGAVTWDRCHVYRDAETLWRDTVSKNSGAWVAWLNLGKACYAAGRCEEAIACCDRAIALNADEAEIYNDRAIARARSGLLGPALLDCRKAIELNPHYAVAYYNLGKIHAQGNDLTEAIGDFDRAIALRPLSLFYNSRAAAYFKIKEYRKALADVKMSEKLGGQPNPEFVKALEQAAARPE